MFLIFFLQLINYIFVHFNFFSDNSEQQPFISTYTGQLRKKILSKNLISNSTESKSFASGSSKSFKIYGRSYKN